MGVEITSIGPEASRHCTALVGHNCEGNSRRGTWEFFGQCGQNPNSRQGRVLELGPRREVGRCDTARGGT